MNTISISIIIATYNTEKYIVECLKSIFNQSLENIEIIVIDDGSTDNSSIVIQKYLEKYGNLVYLYKENAGAGLARNDGIKIAKGEYLAFMDPDDKYPNCESLEKLYKKAKLKNADICGGNIISFIDSKSWFCYKAGDGSDKEIKDGVITAKDYKYLYGHTRYLYKTDFVKKHNILFAPYRRYEDQVFTVKALGIAQKLYEIDYPVYLYRTNYKEIIYNDILYADILKGYRDTIELLYQYELKEMFLANINSITYEIKQSIVKYNFISNREIMNIVCEINAIINKTEWVDKDIISEKVIKELLERVELEKEKIRRIFLNDAVVLYGAGKNTEKLLSVLDENQRKKIKGIAVSSLDNNTVCINEIPVKSICEYYNKKETVTIVVTPSIKFKTEICDYLEENGFEKFVWIDMRYIF